MTYSSIICLFLYATKFQQSFLAGSALLFTMYYYCKVTIFCQMFHSMLTILNYSVKRAGMVQLVSPLAIGQKKSIPVLYYTKTS